MSDRKAAAELIRDLKRKKYRMEPHTNGRVKVFVGDAYVVIPGPKHKTSARGMQNARAALKRQLRIEI